MEVKFDDPDLERLGTDPRYTAKLDAALVKAFRKRLQFISAAQDERAFYAMKSLHYEKLKGDYDGYHSMRLNDQWRLLLRLVEKDAGNQVVIISICDYH